MFINKIKKKITNIDVTYLKMERCLFVNLNIYYGFFIFTIFQEISINVNISMQFRSWNFLKIFVCNFLKRSRLKCVFKRKDEYIIRI